MHPEGSLQKPSPRGQLPAASTSIPLLPPVPFAAAAAAIFPAPAGLGPAPSRLPSGSSACALWPGRASSLTPGPHPPHPYPRGLGWHTPTSLGGESPRLAPPRSRQVFVGSDPASCLQPALNKLCDLTRPNRFFFVSKIVVRLTSS